MEKAYDIHIYVCVYARSESHSTDESQGGSACDLEIEPLLVAAGIRQQVIADGQGSNLRLLHMFRSGQTSNAAVEMLCSFREGPLDCQIHQGRGRFEQARLPLFGRRSLPSSVSYISSSSTLPAHAMRRSSITIHFRVG